LLTSFQAKKELARKEGRLLTKKQKEEQKMAEIRKQALLASGVQIEGLQQGGASTKKVVYGSRDRKKKGPAAKDDSPAPESRPRTPEPAAAVPAPHPEEAKGSNAEDKDDWEASSDEGEKEPEKPAAAAEPVPDVKSDWDDSSDEEGKSTPAPAPVKKGMSQCRNSFTSR
jgi:translation initiation factor 5B